MTTPAIILAAGRGERMRPLTDTTPKPLLKVRGQPLLLWHVQALLRGGFAHHVFNTAWLGEEISSFFEPYRLIDGTFQLPKFIPFEALFSNEQADFGGALETAGGICRALPLLVSQDANQPDVFWVMASDVYVPGFEFTQSAVDLFTASGHLAHLWLVPNPPHNPKGDFGISTQGLAQNLPTEHTGPRHTYSTIGLYRAALFAPPWCDIPLGNPEGIKAPLAPLLRRAMDAGRVSAELYTGPWTDVGTPERLAQLNDPAAVNP